jgi:hypothetical protein
MTRYVALDLDTLAQLATRDDMSPLAFRAWFDALDRMDVDGHAQYSPGELAGVLGRVDVDTGELFPVPRETASRTVAHLVRLSLASRDSGVRCIRLPRRLAQNAAAPRRRCAYHEGRK